MAETLTANYGWTKPDPGASANTWGATLNADLDKIDAQVFSNQQGLAPVGSGALWFTATPPANWLICDGSSLATTGTYAALFAIIGYTFGGSGANFNLPPMPGRFPFGAGSGVALAATGGATTTTLAAGQLPSHAHPITQVAHSHTASQPAHVHPDPGHEHGTNETPHAHGGVMVPTGAGYFSLGVTTPEITQGNTAGATTGITIQPAGANLQAAGGDAVTVNATTPSGPTTTGAIGSGSPVPIMPPFIGLNFIIRYQ